MKCFLKVHKGKYSHVHLIALLTARLSRYHDGFAVAVVDEVSYFSCNDLPFELKSIAKDHAIWHAKL